MNHLSLLTLAPLFIIACQGEITIAEIEKNNGTNSPATDSDTESSSSTEVEKPTPEPNGEIFDPSNESDPTTADAPPEESEIVEENCDGPIIQEEDDILEESGTIDHEDAPDLEIADFDAQWYVYDDGQAYETTSNPAYVVDFHGDADLYWYEKSGAHGLLDSMDPQGDFQILRDYVIEGAEEPMQSVGYVNYQAESTLSTFEFATFTYFLCDFYPETQNTQYYIAADSVDDGIQIILNGEIVGYHTYEEGGFTIALDNINPGEHNSLIITLADDSKYEKAIENLVFLQESL